MKSFPKYLNSKDPKRVVKETIDLLENKTTQMENYLKDLNLNAEAIQYLFNEIYLIDLFILTFIPLIGAGIFSLNRLEYFEKQLVEEGKWTSVIQHGLEGNVVTEINLALGDLADYLVSDKELKRFIQNKKSDLKEYLK